MVSEHPACGGGRESGERGVSVERSPSFSFYPKDWLSDVKVRTMSHPERAAYVDLLCFCWTEDTLPNDPVALAQLLGVPPRTFAKWWPKLHECFDDEDGRLRHRRLDQERADQAAWRASRAAAGRKGAARRWHSLRPERAPPSPENGEAIAEPMPEQATADDTATREPMLENGIAVRRSPVLRAPRAAQTTERRPHTRP